MGLVFFMVLKDIMPDGQGHSIDGFMLLSGGVMLDYL
jgi:hypothetical protein